MSPEEIRAFYKGLDQNPSKMNKKNVTRGAFFQSAYDQMRKTSKQKTIKQKAK